MREKYADRKWGQGRYSYSVSPRVYELIKVVMIQVRHSFKVLLPYAVLSLGLLTIPFLQGNPIGALAIFGIYLIVRLFRYGLPSLDHVALLLLASIFVFDIPSGRPYNDYTAITESIGYFLFSGLSKAYSIPIPLTMFEIASFTLVLGILFRYRLLQTRANVTILVIALSLPIVAGFSLALGVLRGNDLGLGITQTRLLPTFTAWCLISYFLARRPENIRHMFRIVLYGALWKATMGIYVYFVVYGATLGPFEYLIDHLSSLLLATALLMLVTRPIFFPNLSKTQLILSALMFVWIAIPYVLNDRRASFLGLGLALVLLPLVVHRLTLFDLRRRFGYFLLPAALLALAGIALFIAASSDLRMMLQNVLSGSGGDNQPSYRALEDYNLLHGVQFSPFLGLGFGSRYPIMVYLPDISGVFELFDAIPHNQVLYLWTFCGPLGMTALGLVMSLSIQAAVRVCRQQALGLRPYLGFLCFATIVGWFVYIFFDMGLLTTSALVLAGSFIGIVVALDSREE